MLFDDTHTMLVMVLYSNLYLGIIFLIQMEYCFVNFLSYTWSEGIAEVAI